MQWWRTFALVPVLLVAALVASPMTAPVDAQSYDVRINFAFQISGAVGGLLGEGLSVDGTVVVSDPPSESDTITVALSAPDTGVVRTTVTVPASAAALDEFNFAINHVTFTRGKFVLALTSELTGEVLFREEYPVPNYQVSVSLDAEDGEEAVQFLVRTSIDVGNMTLIDNRFDIHYVVDGQEHVSSERVVVLDPDLIDLVGLPENAAYGSWETVQAFSFPPGEHTLEIRVFDHAIAEEVFRERFALTVFDRFVALEEELGTVQDDLAEVRENLTGLQDQTQSLQRSSSVALPLSFLSLVALGVSVLTLLIQFGIVKFGRRPRE